MQKHRHLFLIGFMGSGKSYWGNKLSAVSGMPFIDLDDQITRQVGKTIPEIFLEQGENGFRILERNQLLQINTLESPTIIATGGGTPCFFDNLDIMKTWGITVYLKATQELLAARLFQQKTGRPLISDIDDPELEAYIQEKLDKRKPFYLKADVVLTQQNGSENLLTALIHVA
ncbi:MAG TPA: shikimate kinase, partial [Saprospirales bacterium]|nr:shikimate kinase [Saprospirales bacterium]